MPLKSIEAWAEILPPEVAPLHVPLIIDHGNDHLDRSQASQAALNGESWHQNMLKLVASWVSGGLTNDQIYERAEQHTLPGYTAQQTRDEVRGMIAGARAKGFDKSSVVSIGLDRQAKTSKIANPQNIYDLIKSSAWNTALAFDEFAQRKLLIAKPPNQPGNPLVFKPRDLQDSDYTKVSRWINTNGCPRVAKQIVVDAVNEICAENIISPVKHYLENLSYDPTHDASMLSTWLTAYLGVEPIDAKEQAYVKSVSRLSLIQAVARIFDPGCKADSVPILEGDQGIGKSSALRVLHDHKYFGDALPPMGTKDASDYIRGKWGIELAELAFQRKADVEAQKAFISRQEERFRPAYGREEICYPRQCVFWGTTNRTDYLTDETGNRRFLPIKTGKIDLAGLREVRDKLWAEAVYNYHQGEKWWLDGDQSDYAHSQTQQRLESDAWVEQINLKMIGADETSIKEAFELCFPTKELEKITHSDNRRMAACLLKSGWKKNGRYTSGPKRNQARYVRVSEEN